MKSYTIDPAKIGLEKFKELTAGRSMLPGRVALHEQLEKRFDILSRSGVKHLGDLLHILGSKPKIESFSVQTGLPTEYLVLLRREAASYLARPFPLSDFPGIPFEYVELLKSKGILNTKNFFEQAQTEGHQSELASITGIPKYRLKELFSLCDFSRITGVGGIFARVIYEAGIRSTLEFACIDISEQLKDYLAIMEKYGYEAGNIGEEDIRYSVYYASILVTCDQKSAR